MLKRFGHIVPAALVIGGWLSVANTPSHGQVPNATKPVRVAVVNLKTILDGYQKRTDTVEKLRQFGARNEAALREMDTKINALRIRIRAPSPEDKLRMAQIQKEFTDLQVDRTMKVGMLKFQYQRRFTKAFKEIQGDIHQACKDLAKTLNFDIVLQSAPQGPSEGNLRNFDFSVTDKVLYYSGSVDITDRVLNRLNKKYSTE